MKKYATVQETIKKLEYDVKATGKKKNRKTRTAQKATKQY